MKKDYNDIYLVNQIDEPNIRNNKLSGLEFKIQNQIIEYLTIRGIEKERLFFTNFTFVKVDIENKKLSDNGKLITITNKNTINELFEILSNNKESIIINLNSTLASTIKDNEMNFEDYLYTISWKNMI